jgi:hypothetical protein
MQTLYKVYQDATTIPNETGTSQFDVSNTLNAGQLRRFGLRFTTVNAAAITSASFLNLVRNLRIRFNGNTWMDWNGVVADNADNTVSRIGAFAQDCGGYVAEQISATATECVLWFPCGINLPQNSRVECSISFSAAASALTSGSFELWAEYGNASAISVYGGSTTETLAAGSQTMVTVKIPSYPNAKVAGVAVLAPTDGARVTSVIPKGVSDFALSEVLMEGLAGITDDQYYYADPASAGQYLFANQLNGYNFLPLFNMDTSSGSITLLVDDDVGGIFSFVPVLTIPVATGGKEQIAKQTANIVSGGAAESIVERAE